MSSLENFLFRSSVLLFFLIESFVFFVVVIIKLYELFVYFGN